MYLRLSLPHSKRYRQVQGPEAYPAWQCALACSTALALLASLLWLAPWQYSMTAPPLFPSPCPYRAATVQPRRQPSRPFNLLSHQPLKYGPLPSTSATQSPEQPHTSATSEQPTEVLDTQAMQELVIRLEAARSNPEEHLDTRAMDRLLARLESADKTGSLPSPRSKMAKKRGPRVLPRAGGRGAPGSVSPPRADSAPLGPASGMQLPDRFEIRGRTGGHVR